MLLPPCLSGTDGRQSGTQPMDHISSILSGPFFSGQDSEMMSYHCELFPDRQSRKAPFFNLQLEGPYPWQSLGLSVWTRVVVYYLVSTATTTTTTIRRRSYSRSFSESSHHRQHSNPINLHSGASNRMHRQYLCVFLAYPLSYVRILKTVYILFCTIALPSHLYARNASVWR